MQSHPYHSTEHVSSKTWPHQLAGVTYHVEWIENSQRSGASWSALLSLATHSLCCNCLSFEYCILCMYCWLLQVAKQYSKHEMIECYIYICRTWRERDTDDWVWSRDLWASSAGLSNRISEKKPVKPVCPGLCLPECLETRNNGSRGGHTNYDYTMGTHDIVWG